MVEKKKSKSNSGETSKRVLRTAAAFLALDEDERIQWIESKLNWPTVVSWAASLTSQAPDRKKAKKKRRRKGLPDGAIFGGGGGEPEGTSKRKRRATSSRVLLAGGRPRDSRKDLSKRRDPSNEPRLYLPKRRGLTRAK
jgi:hypothetical protein